MDITALDPISEVHLLKGVPLDNTYKHTLTFADKTAQFAYFSGKAKTGAVFDKLTPVDLNNAVMLPINSYTIYDCNYMMFKNANFSSKWLYAFITNIEYVSVNCCKVSFELDLMQTWYFDYQLKQSFVVREHVTNDAIGANLVEEGLEVGEYVPRNYIPVQELQEIWYVMGDTSSFGGRYSGIYTGLIYTAFDPDLDGQIDGLSNIIANYNNAGTIDSIQTIFTIPKGVLPAGISNNTVIQHGTELRHFDFTIDCSATDINGYTPKNKKLLAYPYNLLYATNNNGKNAEYRIENFSSSAVIKFDITGNIAPLPTVMATPTNYKGVTNYYEEGITLEGFPLCSWRDDVYKNWLAQNGKSIAINTVVDGVAVAGGLVSGNPMAVIGGAMGVLQHMGEMSTRASQPPQARGNINNGALNCGMYSNTFYFSHLNIKREFAERIDRYFDLYGYKVNMVKVPNRTGRPSWNYVQTIDANVTGSIPFNDISKIRSIYDSGITFWHGDYVGDYTRDNTI